MKDNEKTKEDLIKELHQLRKELDEHEKKDKQAESEIFFHLNLLNAAGQAIIATDLYGNIIYWNPYAEKLYGWHQIETLAQNIMDVGIIKISKKKICEIIDNIKEGHSLSDEINTYDINGKKIPVLMVNSPIYNNKEEIFGVISVLTDITKIKEIELELTKSHEKLRKLSEHIQNTREKERKLIANEIHDDLGQILTVVKMDLSLLKNSLKQDPCLCERIDSISDLTDMTIKTVNKILSGLKPCLLDELGVIAAIKWQMEQFCKKTGIGCKLNFYPDDIDINDRELSIILFRIIQEILVNIEKHANAKNVEVNLEKKKDNIILKIKDDGIGIAEKQIHSPNSFGLISMQERLYFWDGKVDIRRNKERGTIVEIKVPIKKTNH